MMTIADKLGRHVLPWRVLLVSTAIVALVGLVLAAFAIRSAREEAETIRLAAYEACVHIGNPINYAVETLLRNQIENSRGIGHELFPDIPRDVFDRLMREQQAQRRELLHQITRTPDCDERYLVP